MLSKDEYFMLKALRLAKIANDQGEVPIGAIIVKNSEVIAAGYNKKEQKQNSLFHAEMECINRACKKLNNWRLLGCTLYVTLEPCMMCMGAIVNSRISRVVFGTLNSCNKVHIQDLINFNYSFKLEVIGGALENKCSKLLKNFFKDLRKSKN